MTAFNFNSELQYYQQQILSGTDDQEDSPAMQQSQYQAQFLLEDCDTPPPSKWPISYNLSNSPMIGGVGPAGRGDVRDVLRPYCSGISPRYNRNGTIRKSDGGGPQGLEQIENPQQELNDPFTSSGQRVASSTSSLDSETTIRNSPERGLSADDCGMFHDTWDNDEITPQTRLQQFQSTSYHFVETKQALAADSDHDNYFTGQSMHYGEQLVLTHAKRPSHSDPAQTPSPKKHRTMAGQAIGDLRNGSPRKSKRNETGQELARKFREDANRWWKIVVNPTGRWIDP